MICYKLQIREAPKDHQVFCRICAEFHGSSTAAAAVPTHRTMHCTQPTTHGDPSGPIPPQFNHSHIGRLHPPQTEKSNIKSNTKSHHNSIIPTLAGLSKMDDLTDDKIKHEITSTTFSLSFLQDKSAHSPSPQKSHKVLILTRHFYYMVDKRHNSKRQASKLVGMVRA